MNLKSANTKFYSHIKKLSNKKLALLGGVVFVVLALLVIAVSTISNKKIENTPIIVTFGYPSFDEQDGRERIILPIYPTRKLTKDEAQAIITINDEALDREGTTSVSKQGFYTKQYTPQGEGGEIILELEPNSMQDVRIAVRPKEGGVYEYQMDLDSSKPATILGIIPYSKQQTLEVFLSKNVHLDSAHAQTFIELKDTAGRVMDYKVLTQGSKLIITSDFAPTQAYTLTLKNPFNLTQTIDFPSLKPELKFLSQGTILARDNDLKIGILNTNIRKSLLTIYKIYDNNIHQFLYSLDNSADSVGDIIWEQEISFDTNRDTNQTILDLSALLRSNGKTLEKGVYFLRFQTFKNDILDSRKSSDDDDADYPVYSVSPSKTIIISDIALIANEDKNKIIAYALDSITSAPLSGVKLSLISASNQVIDSKTSDSNGRAEFSTISKSIYRGDTDTANNTDQQRYKSQASYIVAQLDDDKNYLSLKSRAPVFDGIDVFGAQKGGRKVFTYTDRGIAVPGESIQLNALIRDKNTQDAPISLSIINPRGSKIIKDMPIKPIGFGLYSYTFETDSTFATGGYTAEFIIGGERFSQDFQVEYIIPNKIRLDIEAPKQAGSSDNILHFNLASSYLSGAKSAGLKYRLHLLATPLFFTSKTHKDFDFYGKSDFQYETLFNGSLNEQGIANIAFDTKPLNTAKQPKNLKISLNAQVFESTGHPVHNIASTAYYGANVLGVKTPGRYVNLTKPLNLPVVLLDPKTDKPIANIPLTYKIYRNNRYWWFDYNDREMFDAKIKSDINTTIIKEGTLVSSNTPIELHENLSGLVEDYDSVFIEISDNKGATNVVWLVADMYESAAVRANPIRLPIELDKEFYNVGENATLSFMSNGYERALITLSYGDEIIQSEIIKTTGSRTTYQIPLLASYAPNLYASVTLIAAESTMESSQSAQGTRSSRSNSKPPSKRRFGLVSIPVVNSLLNLKPKLEVAQTIKPGSTMRVHIANPAKKQMAYTLAIIDSGILDIINFKTPNPYKELYSKNRFEAGYYDNYDDFISQVLGVIHQSVLIGGDSGEEGSKANFSKKRKENLVYFVSGLSDEKGEATIEYALPNYVGSARVMLIASDENSVGSNQQEVMIADSANLYSNLPEEIKINDEIIVPLEVVAQDGIEIQNVQMRFEGDVAITKLQSIMNKQKTRFMQYVSVRPKALGKAHFKAYMEASTIDRNNKTSGVKKVNQHNDYVVNVSTSNAPQSFEEVFMLKPSQERKLQATERFVPGSLHQTITISPTLLFAYQDKVEYLLHYLYGCIEQSVSATMPLLLGFEGTRAMSPDEIKQKAQSSINRIIKFQRGNSGFGYWLESSDTSHFGSDYAAFFLLLAKQKGFNVPDYVLSNWARYAQNYVANYDVNNRIKTFTLFLLALYGKPNIAMMNEVYSKSFSLLNLREKLSLAAAYKLSGLDMIAKEIRSKLPKDLLSADLYKHKEQGNIFNYYYYGSDLSSKAMSAYFLALLDNEPNITLLHSIAKTLQDSRWLGTQDIATSLLALHTLESNSTKQSDKKTNNKSVRFVLDGKAYEVVERTQFVLDPNIPHSLSAKDTIYVSFANLGVLAKDPLEIPAVANNLTLSRSFFMIDKNGNRKEIDPARLNLNDEFYIELHLQNTSDRGVRNLALTQIIPSGWEIQNMRIVRQSDDEDEMQENIQKDFANRGYVSYMDILRDRVVFFFDNWISPTYEYYGENEYNTYKVYIKCVATLAGSYVLGGAFAEAMYDGDYNARTKAIRVQVQ